MSSLVDTLEHGGLVLSGAVVCFLFLQWRGQRGIDDEGRDGQSRVEQGRREAEMILRDARLRASEETLKVHEQTEEALAGRRAERLEFERRLSERETLINSQLARIVESEKNLNQEADALRGRAAALS